VRRITPSAVSPSPIQRSALEETLTPAGAGGDAELLAAAKALLEAIKADAPGVAETVGVDLSRIEAVNINIEDITAREGSVGVRASDVHAEGDVNISGVDVGGARHSAPAAQTISNAHSRGDMKAAGRDIIQHGASMPPIEVDLDIKAEPLLRLFYDNEVVDHWKTLPWGRAVTYGTAAILLGLGVLLVTVPDAIPGLTIPHEGTMNHMTAVHVQFTTQSS